MEHLKETSQGTEYIPEQYRREHKEWVGGAGAHHFNNISHLTNKVMKAIKSVGWNCFCEVGLYSGRTFWLKCQSVTAAVTLVIGCNSMKQNSWDSNKYTNQNSKTNKIQQQKKCPIILNLHINACATTSPDCSE